MGLSLAQIFLSFFKTPTLRYSFRILASGQFAFTALSLTSLIHAYVVSDFSMMNVLMNSHSSKSFFYKFLGAWSNHEGSLLLWLFMMSLLSFLFAWLEKEASPTWYAKTLGIKGVLFVLFSLYLFLFSDPFERVWPIPHEGFDLNPLLQDPGLAFHPPVLYLGFVGFSIIYALSLGYALSGTDENFSLIIRPWLYLVWGGLTLGIVGGSFWAYYVLGWGGWWFWDPVENISLLPWVSGLLLFHALSSSQKNHGKFILALGALPFILGVSGTFLVRSGSLVSVHSFASDLGRFQGLLVVLAFVLLGAIFILNQFKRWSFPLFNHPRKYALLLGFFFLGVLMMSLLYPLLRGVLTHDTLMIGPNYFETFLIGVLSFGGLFLFSYGTALSFKKSFLFFGIATGALWGLFFPLKTALFLMSGFFFIWGMGALVLKKNTLQKRLVFLMHVFIGGIILSSSLNSFFHEDLLFSLKIGEEKKLGSFSFEIKSIDILPDATSIDRRFNVSFKKNNEKIGMLLPLRKFFYVKGQFISTSAIYTNGFENVQTLAGDPLPSDRWQLRVYYDPFINFIWIFAILCGVFSIFLGILSLQKRVRHFP